MQKAHPVHYVKVPARNTHGRLHREIIIILSADRDEHIVTRPEFEDHGRNNSVLCIYTDFILVRKVIVIVPFRLQNFSLLTAVLKTNRSSAKPGTIDLAACEKASLLHHPLLCFYRPHISKAIFIFKYIIF